MPLTHEWIPRGWGGVARKLRVQYPGAIYQLMNRGDRREPIFKDDHDRLRFMETLGEACHKTGWQVPVYCLMGSDQGKHPGGEARRETDEQNAQRVLTEELKKRGWTDRELKKRRKTDAAKVKMAVRLRAETVMTLDWIAQQLRMGCRHTLANCLKTR
jgi:hypothetical protein